MLLLSLVESTTCITARESVAQKIEMEQTVTSVTIVVKITVATASINSNVSCTFSVVYRL